MKTKKLKPGYWLSKCGTELRIIHKIENGTIHYEYLYHNTEWEPSKLFRYRNKAINDRFHTFINPLEEGRFYPTQEALDELAPKGLLASLKDKNDEKENMLSRSPTVDLLNRIYGKPSSEVKVKLVITLEELSQLESTLRLAIEDEEDQEVHDGVWLRIAHSTLRKLQREEHETRMKVPARGELMPDGTHMPPEAFPKAQAVKPRKLLAFEKIALEGAGYMPSGSLVGRLAYAIEGSDDHKDFESSDHCNLWKRAPGFDMEEKAV